VEALRQNPSPGPMIDRSPARSALRKAGIILNAGRDDRVS
jgi:hypothetical protein